MSAAADAIARPASPAAVAPPEVTAWPIAPGAVLFVGRTTQPVPPSGHAQLENRPADSGPFRAYSWPAETHGVVAFVAAVRLPQATYLLPGQTLFLTQAPPERGASPALRLPVAMGGPQAFMATATAVLQGVDTEVGVGLAQFLLTTFPPSAMQRVPMIGTMLVGLLAGLATDDGCIEVMGAVPGACGFLQGWGGPIDADPQATDGSLEALLAGERVARCRMRVATFARPDILPPSAGMVLVVNHPTGQGPDPATLAAFPGLEHVYLLTPTGVLRRTVVEPRVLSPAESSGHIRDMLPSLSCPPRAADCLRLALRPRYAGRETVTTQPLPVRAAIDHALLLPAEGAHIGGVYACGWLFDPLRLVTDVTLRSPAGEDAPGFAVRLDPGWTRVERNDVSIALAKEGFPPPPDDLHGFAVFAEGNLPAGAPLYLDIAFRDATCAFLPVAASSADAQAARTRVLEGTDLHKPSGLAVIEQQLGPFCLARMRRPPSRRAPLTSPAATVAVAVVIALVGPPSQPRAVLSQFLHDPLQMDECLIIVAGAAWGAGHIATLRRTIGFMRLNAHVVAAADVVDAGAALDVAANFMAARHYLLLDPAVVGTAPGWRGAMRHAAEHARTLSVSCPTLLYEDLSIRFAGGATLTTLELAPYAMVTRKKAGMPAGFAAKAGAEACETALGSLACCLVPAPVLAALGGAQTALGAGFGQETGFFLRLQAANIPCLWVPQAIVYAPDMVDPPAPLRSVSRLVDGWCLREAMTRGLFSAMPPAVAKSLG